MAQPKRVGGRAAFTRAQMWPCRLSSASQQQLSMPSWAEAACADADLRSGSSLE